MAMTSAQLIAWQGRHARRARAWWSGGAAGVVGGGAALAAWVGLTGGGAIAWLGGAVAAFAVAFLRVPFQLYWRADAGFLAQLPIDGTALFDVAAWRCARGAIVTTVAVLIGALPLAAGTADALPRAAAIALAMGAAAAGLLPAIATWGATLVATSAGGTSPGMRLAAALATASPTGAARAAVSAQPPAPSALLGALPGFGATVVIVLVVIEARWLAGTGPAPVSAAAVLGGLVVASVAAWLGARALAPRHMGTILRDVSALDRQRLAALEIRPPTAIERGVAALLGPAAALPYRKDARLVRRRYPMAFALGALAFLVLVILGLAQARWVWAAAILVGTVVYGATLAARLRRPPIELARLTATLPIEPAAVARAKLAWLAAWWVIFAGVPGAFALLRLI